MKHLSLKSIISDMNTNPLFSTFEGRIYDQAPINYEKTPFIAITVISDVPQSWVHNQARVEVRAVFDKSTHTHSARDWYDILDSYFVGNMKLFGTDEVYQIDLDGRQFFIDDSGFRIVLCDYYFNYLVW